MTRTRRRLALALAALVVFAAVGNAVASIRGDDLKPTPFVLPGINS